MRMPKGWVLVGTNAFEFGNTETRQERVKREARFDKAIRNAHKATYEQLVKEADEAYIEAQARKEQLRAAYKAGILRSPRLIAEAKG